MKKELVSGGDQGGKLSYTVNEMRTKVATIPSGLFFWRLIGYPHDEIFGGAMQQWQARLQEKLGDPIQVEAALARVFDPGGTGPQTLDEEELMRLVNLRGALGVLAGVCINRSPIPQELKDTYIANANHPIDTEEYNLGRIEILREIYDWSKKHPKDDKPIHVDEMVEEKLRSIYARMEAIMRFYAEKRPLISKEQYEAKMMEADEEYERRGKSGTFAGQYPLTPQQSDDIHRYEAVTPLISMFDPQKPLEW